MSLVQGVTIEDPERSTQGQIKKTIAYRIILFAVFCYTCANVEIYNHVDVH